MNPFKHIILRFLKNAFLVLSKADGRSGLSAMDFEVVLGRVSALGASELSGRDKASDVSAWLVKITSGKITPWVSQLLTHLAYLYAQKKGLIK